MNTPDLFPDFDATDVVAILASAYQATRAGQSLLRHYQALAVLWPGEFATPANLERRLRRIQDEHRRQRDQRPQSLAITPVTFKEAKPDERLLLVVLGGTTEAFEIVPNTPANHARLKNPAVQLYRFTR